MVKPNIKVEREFTRLLRRQKTEVFLRKERIGATGIGIETRNSSTINVEC